LRTVCESLALRSRNNCFTIASYSLLNHSNSHVTQFGSSPYTPFQNHITPPGYRSGFEKVVSICGSDVTTSNEVWTRYLEWEIEEYEDVAETFPDSDKQQKAKVILALYHNICCALFFR
jgi:hypothetical protein